MTTRPNRLLNDPDLDVSGFEPKKAPEPVPPKEIVRKVAEEGGFARERDKQAPASSEGPAFRPPRTYRSGRTVTFSVKTTPAAVASFYALCDAKGWKVAETFEWMIDQAKKHHA